jgi:hypothetical protein
MKPEVVDTGKEICFGQREIDLILRFKNSL